MKTPNDYIFRLIKAMSAAEKRYFKIHFASDKSLMTALFDHLNQLDYYHEIEIKAHFSNTKLGKNLKVYKVQLTDSILKSLASFRHKKSLQDKLRIGIEEINTLRAKQLFEVAENKLKQLKKLATQYEQYHYLLQLLQIELDLGHFLLNSSAQEATQTFNLTVKKISNVNRLRFLYNDFQQIIEQLFFRVLSEEELERFKDYKQCFVEPKPEIEFINQYYQDVLHTLHSIILYQDYDIGIEKMTTLRQAFHNDKKFTYFQIYPELYWQCQYCLLKNLVEKKEYATAQGEINKLHNWLVKTPEIQYCTFYLVYLQIEMAYLQEDFTKVNSLEKQFLETLKQEKEVQRYEVVKGLIYLVAIHIRQQNFAKAHFYLRRLHAKAKKLPKIFSPFFDLLELISHYQSDEFLMLQNLVAAFRRKQYNLPQKSNLFDDLLHVFSLISKGEQNKSTFIRLSSSSKYQDDCLLPLYHHFKLQKLIDLESSNDTLKKSKKGQN